MPTTTPNLGLTKDYEGEPYSLARINANSDRLDTFAGEALTDTVYDTTGIPALIKKRKIADVETPVTIETPDTTPTEGSKHLITSGAVHAALASKQDALSQAQLDAVNSGITAEKLTADEAALAEVVDEGAKNRAIENTFSNTGYYKQVKISPIITGDFVISIDNITSTDTDASKCAYVFIYTDGSTSSPTMINRDAAYRQTIANTKEIAAINIYPSDNYTHSSGDTVSVTNLMICSVQDWAISQKYAPYALSNPTLTPAVIKTVDSGAKNVLNFTSIKRSDTNYGTSVYTDGVRFVLNTDGSITATREASSSNNAYVGLCLSGNTSLIADDFCDGDHVLSGCPSGESSSTYRLYAAKGTYAKYDTGNGVILTSTAETGIVINCIVYSGFSGTVTFKPMICTLADWNASQKYVPYCPSMAEMYAMILALQSGGNRSLSMRTTEMPVADADPEEIKEPETGEEGDMR